MNHLSLFAGIGGFDLAADRAGFRTVAFVERDAYAQRVLAKHWPGVPIYPDICGFRWEGEPITVLSGGFPCQDISIAGDGSGLAGEHSGLWTEFYRLICEIRPRYAIVENSPALCSRGLGEILGQLSDVGYDAEWDGIPAAAVGAPHLRARQWIVAYPSSVGDGLPEEGLLPRRIGPEHGHWWTRESGVRRVDDGTRNRVDRLRCLGNAVVPQVAYPIFRAIAEIEMKQQSLQDSRK